MYILPSRPIKHQSAFTLIEVVIFIAISSILLVAIVSLSINIMRQTSVSQHKLYASRYADELAEWLRIQKEISWQDFFSAVQTLPGASKTYCVNDDIGLTSDLITMLAGGDCVSADGIRAPNPGPKVYKRTVTFPEQSDSTVSLKGTIRVEWREANNAEYEVQIETLFAPR